MKKQICALLLCLAALFSLAGCGTKPKTPVKGQNEPNPVKAQGLPEAEPGCVPLLLTYTCGEPGSQVFQYYSATWNIQRNTLTQGQLFYTGTSYGFVPDGWRQERATFDGQSFTYIREGQERREPLPETTEDRGSLQCAAADGDTAVVVYMSYAGDDASLTVSVGRYPLGHPEQAAWVQAQISDSAECYVSTIFTGTTLYTGGQVCLAAGESILLMDPASGEVRQLDLSPMSAPLRQLWRHPSGGQGPVSGGRVGPVPLCDGRLSGWEADGHAGPEQRRHHPADPLRPRRKDRRKQPADDGGLCGLRRHGFAGGVHRPAVPSAINAAARAGWVRAVFPAKNTNFLPESP